MATQLGLADVAVAAGRRFAVLEVIPNDCDPTLLDLRRVMNHAVESAPVRRAPLLVLAAQELDGFILKMRGAVRGYSGFFDYVQVNTDLLDQVYEHDMSLIQEVETLAGSIEQLAGKPDTTEAGPSDLLHRIDEVERKFAHRGELLNGLGS